MSRVCLVESGPFHLAQRFSVASVPPTHTHTSVTISPSSMTVRSPTVCMRHLYPLSCCWVPGLLPFLSGCELGFNEHACASIPTRLHVGVHRRGLAHQSAYNASPALLLVVGRAPLSPNPHWHFPFAFSLVAISNDESYSLKSD